MAIGDEALHQFAPPVLPDTPIKIVVRAAPPRQAPPLTTPHLLLLLSLPLASPQGTEEVFAEMTLPVVAHPTGGKDRFGLTLRPGDYVTVLNEVPRQDELWRKLYARAPSLPGAPGAAASEAASQREGSGAAAGAAGDESGDPRRARSSAADGGEGEAAASGLTGPALEEQEAKHNRYFSKKRQESLWTDGVLLKISRKGHEEAQAVIAPLVPLRTIRKKHQRYDKEDSDSARPVRGLLPTSPIRCKRLTPSPPLPGPPLPPWQRPTAP